MRFKGIVFDLDGTLLDTLEDIGDAVNRTLDGQGFPVHETDAYRFFIGDGFLKLMTRALPEHERASETIDRCMEIFRSDYGQHWARKTRLYPGIADMLDGLIDRGLKLAVLSNKAHDLTRTVVAKLLPHWKFHAVLGQRSGIPPKPDPYGALEIARNLDLAPSDFLYLGDSAVDMKTAVAAGMFPVGACWGFRPAEELKESGSKVLIDKPMEIFDLLD